LVQHGTKIKLQKKCIANTKSMAILGTVNKKLKNN
jgi:hypothetical protein